MELDVLRLFNSWQELFNLVRAHDDEYIRIFSGGQDPLNRSLEGVRVLSRAK